MNRLANAINSATVNTPNSLTANGAAAYVTTTSPLVDFIGNAGSVVEPKDREFENSQIVRLFAPLFKYDIEKAMRAAFWLRDSRGGSGRRQSFRLILKWLEANDPITLVKVLPYVPHYGRWDDLLIFTPNSNIERAAFGIIRDTLNDVGNNAAGLCAKWMPRKGPIAVRLTKYLGLNPRGYRKFIVSLTNVVETAMCARDWGSVNFNHVPSVAMARYTRAFNKRMPEKFAQYKSDLIAAMQGKVTASDVKINVDALYPHDIIRSMNLNPSDVLIDIQWEKLKEKYGNITANILPLIDVSGSMGVNVSGSVTAMDVSVSLGMFLSELQTGPFNGMSLTFSDKPTFINTNNVSGLYKKAELVYAGVWGMSTNIEKAFNEILNFAKTNKVTQDEMPEYLLVMSDMQFNRASRYDMTIHNTAKQMFDNAGYKLPTIVYWNLNTYENTNPVTKHETGTILVSGFSPALIDVIFSGNFENVNPDIIANEVINKPRYDLISEALNTRVELVA